MGQCSGTFIWNRVILCHNDKAGKNEHKKAEVLEALRLAGIQAEYCSTGRDSFPNVLDTGADLIIAAGGDGTVGKIAKHIDGRNVKLGILPIDAANNIARSFGIYGAPHEVAEGWRNGYAFPCRLATTSTFMKDMLVIESAGIGHFSDAIKDKVGGKNLGANNCFSRAQAYIRVLLPQRHSRRVLSSTAKIIPTSLSSWKRS